MSTFKVYNHIPCLPCIAGPVGDTGPTGTIFRTTAYDIASNPNPLGPATGTEYTNIDDLDDTSFEIIPPFPVTFLNQEYSKVYIGTNSYLTFGAGSDAFYNISGFNPPVPGLLVNANNNSLSRYYLDTSLDGTKFTIRYEGQCATNVYIIPEYEWIWEISFYRDSPNIDIGWVTPVANANGVNGIFIISSGQGTVQNLPKTNCGVLLSPSVVTYKNIRFSGDGISLIYNNDVRAATTPTPPEDIVGRFNIQPLGGITVDTVGNITKLGSANFLKIITNNGLTLQGATSNQKCSNIDFTAPGAVDFIVDNTHNVNISRLKYIQPAEHPNPGTLYVDENKFLRIQQ